MFVQQNNSPCLQIAATLCITNLIDKNEEGLPAQLVTGFIDLFSHSLACTIFAVLIEYYV